MANANCLAGMGCPQCGSDPSFQIAITASAIMYDEGCEASAEEITWDDTSYCECQACLFAGTVADFRASGPCSLWGEPAKAMTAYLHQGRYVGLCCWDEHLRTTG
jgi:hypothetical protein